MHDDESTAVAAAALRAWLEADHAAAGHPPGAKPGAPMAVRRPDGTIDHWFVPVTAGDRLVAFLRVTRGAVLHGVSRFQPAAAAADWLDPATVQRRAMALAAPGETAGKPQLTFDGSPERLAWAVPLDSTQGSRWIFVAGHAAWPQAG